MRRTARRRGAVDGKRIFRRPDTFRKIGLPFHHGEIQVAALSVQWRALFDGAVVGQLDIFRPQMNFVSAPAKANSQIGIDKPWTQKIKQLFPLKFNRFSVHDGEIHYRDFYRNPKVDVIVDRVQMVATNLTNSKKLSQSLIAEVVVREMTSRSAGKLVGSIID